MIDLKALNHDKYMSISVFVIGAFVMAISVDLLGYDIMAVAMWFWFLLGSGFGVWLGIQKR